MNPQRYSIGESRRPSEAALLLTVSVLEQTENTDRS
jgi:hypothetical protein